MAHHTENSIKVNVSAEKIWAVLQDFASVEKFAPEIKSSPIVNDTTTGVGAKRKCTFNDGSSLVEEIVEYNEGEGYTMELSEHTLPLKSMLAQMKVKAIDEHSSEITMSADFVVKGGPFGWLMGQFLMRSVLKGVFKKVMTGLAYYVVTGNAIETKLPSDEALVDIIC